MNKKETAIIAQALDRLEKLTGIQPEWKIKPHQKADGLLTFRLNNQQLPFNVEARRELREHHLPAIIEKAGQQAPLIVIAQRIFPKLKEALRQQHIAYLDGAGNLYLDAKGVLVWLEGQKMPNEAMEIKNRAFTKTGLRVIFQLLLDEETINMPYRDIARMAGVALGNINYVINGLRETGFVLQLDARRLRLQKKTELLDRWIAGYQELLKPALHLGRFRFVRQEDFYTWERLFTREENTVWGGEPGEALLTGQLKPGLLTLYTDKTKADIMKTGRLIPDPAGNVAVFEKFWQHEVVETVRHAPPLLIYTDLMLTGDPRCQEAAALVYDKYLTNAFA